MVLHIGFWDFNKDVVTTGYYSSEFLGKSSANDLCSHFEQCLGPLEKEKLFHISSDRPNVNLLFLKVRTEKHKNEELSQLIDLGTCGLHTAHNAFKHGDKSFRLTTQKKMYLWAKYSMKHLKGVLITKLLSTLRRMITPCNLLLTGVWKMIWLQKKQGRYSQKLLKYLIGNNYPKTNSLG